MIRCRILGHDSDPEAQAHGYQLCRRCGFEEAPGVYSSAAWDRLAIIAYRVRAAWWTLRRRFHRCPDCRRWQGFGKHQDCIPF